MKVAEKNSKKSSRTRQAPKKNGSNNLKDAPFFKKKMAKANKILASAPLPG
jgi:hypothetical protein